MRIRLPQLGYSIAIRASALALTSCERPEQVCASNETLDGVSGIFFKQSGADDPPVLAELRRNPPFKFGLIAYQGRIQTPTGLPVRPSWRSHS